MLARMWALHAAKARRWAKQYRRILWRESVAPLYERGLLLQLLSIPFLLIITLLVLDKASALEELATWTIAVLAVVATVPIWIGINILRVPALISKEERENGEWFGPRFVYRAPRLVHAVQVGPRDNERFLPFHIDDAEPDSFVQLKLEHDGGLAVAGAGLIKQPVHGHGVIRETRYGVRLSGQSSRLYVECPENSDPTVVRVYMLSWEL